MINIATQAWIGVLEESVKSREYGWFKKKDPKDIVSDGVIYSVISQSQLGFAKQKGSFSKVQLTEIAAVTAQKYSELVQSNRQNRITNQEFDDQAIKLYQCTEKLINRKVDKIDIFSNFSQMKIGLAGLINAISDALFNVRINWCETLIKMESDYWKEQRELNDQLSPIRQWKEWRDELIADYEFKQRTGRERTDADRYPGDPWFNGGTG